MTSVQTNQETALMAHLLRRASFGATPDELERATRRGYEETVEDLLNPVEVNELPEDLIRRYHVDQSDLRNRASAGAYWVYRMVNTRRPLEEKMALFWHRVFATAATKLIQARVVTSQIEMFRQYGMGSFQDLLVRLSKDPAMLMWLDNQDNHKDSINENFGREILELFSMGVGNYTEDDIKECARAFTGWRVVNPEYMSIKMRNNTARPYGYIAWQFEYDEADHDHGIKNFLGESGDFNGEDVVDIICKQDATPRFIARQLYHFFVADEPPVPQWPHTEPRDPEAIDVMVKAYFEHDYSIKAMLQAMFNSDFFKSKDARFARIKSPAEMVVGTLRLAGGIGVPSMDTYTAANVSAYMGQDLLNPPSVEGWQGGEEWINTGAYVHRINFASKVIGDASKPGIRSLVDRVGGRTDNSPLPPDQLVDTCLELLGPMPVLETTRQGLIDYAGKWGDLRFDSPDAIAESDKRIIIMLQLVVTTQEYQMV
ncbi:MAG: DUF1800 domain-containing protein [Chloroflexi bacterium]|nr:DUF1800 domain-containing protein [Chloroflexota bacterium]